MDKSNDTQTTGCTKNDANPDEQCGFDDDPLECFTDNMVREQNINPFFVSFERVTKKFTQNSLVRCIMKLTNGWIF